MALLGEMADLEELSPDVVVPKRLGVSTPGAVSLLASGTNVPFSRICYCLLWLFSILSSYLLLALSLMRELAAMLALKLGSATELS